MECRVEYNGQNEIIIELNLDFDEKKCIKNNSKGVFRNKRIYEYVYIYNRQISMVISIVLTASIYYTSKFISKRNKSGLYIHTHFDLG